MSDLDDKLREIKIECYDGPFLLKRVPLSDNEIAQIKQAFADAGYVQLPNIKGGDYIIVNSKEFLVNNDNTYTPVVRMTGPEWYAKFEKELAAYTGLGNGQVFQASWQNVLEAAKRAAGLDITTELPQRLPQTGSQAEPIKNAKEEEN